MFWRQKIYFQNYEQKAFEAALEIELALHKINGGNFDYWVFAFVRKEIKSKWTFTLH